MLKKILVSFLWFVLTAGNILANTIIFSQRYTADPTVIVYDGRVYIYASHDVKGQAGFKMDGYTCFSSDDLLNWTDHGEVLKASQIPYVNHFWAPEAVYHNGKFYLYFCQDHVGTGVVESDSPLGPWTDVRGSLLMTGHKVDVAILIDDSGTPYAYWPNGPVKRLKQNMYEFEPGEWNTHTNDVHEGPDVFRANNRIYYSYMTFNDHELWSCAPHNSGCNDEPHFANYFHRYHFLNSPTGTAVEPGGVHGRTMMWPLYGDNTHPAVFEFHGQHYSFYHSKLLMTERNEPGFHRNVGLDRLYFNPDGTIIPQAITKEGLRQVKYLNPYIQQDAATIGREHGIETLPTADEGGGRKVGFIDNGDWIKLFGVDFGSGASQFQARVASPIGGGTIQARLGSVNGPLVATLTVPNTGGWDMFTTVTTSVSEASGVHDLYFVFSGGFDFNWWKFDGGTVSNRIPPRVIKPVSLRGRTNDRYVTGSAGGLVPNSETVGVDQQFYLFDNEDGTYSLFSKGMNAWVTHQNGALAATKSSIDSNDEKFLLMHTPDGSYCLFSQSANSYIQAPDGTGALVSGIDQPWEEPYRSDSRFWIDYLDIPVTIASEPTYDFDDGTFQGWTDLTPPNSNSGPRHWALSPPAFPGVAHSGSVAIGQEISGGNQDSSHPTLWLRSPEFLLDGSGALRVWLRGGTGSGSLAGVPVASVPANSSNPGFQGVALRNAVTQTFVLSGSRTSSVDSWEEIVFTASELATLDQTATYTIDLIDAGHGGWGWIAMDSVTIPGVIPGQEPAAPPTISSISGQTILVNTNTDELAFTVGSDEVDPGTLTLSGSSSNTTLVPNTNIVFGGSGEERTVTVTPAAGQLGSSTITITVSDGERTANSMFVVNVFSDLLPIEFDFADGNLSGWMEASTDGEGRQYFAVVPPGVNSPNLTPQSGGHFIGLHIPAFTLDDPAYTQDNAHETLILRSPEFTLNGSGDLTAWLSGGGTGSPTLAGTSVGDLPSASVDGGFRGIALRDVNTGTYVLSGTKTAGGNDWEQVGFTGAELAALPQEHVYTLDLIDAAHGGWGWVNMDTVTIPGALIDEPVPPGIPMLSIEHSGENEVRLSWPAAFSGWTLRRSTNVDGEYAEAGLPVTVEGDENAVYDTIDSERQFYRLIR